MKYDFFLEYLRIYGTENTAGGSITWARGWRARPTPQGAPPSSWAHGGPPPLNSAPIQSFFLPQTPISSSSTSSSSFCCDFRFPCLKHLSQNCLGGIVPWYVTPPLVQLVFVLVLYSLQFVLPR